MNQPPTGSRFLENFLDAYSKCYKALAPAARNEAWIYHWNQFMLRENASRPTWLAASVIAETAKGLGVKYWKGEPLRLDGVFYH